MEYKGYIAKIEYDDEDRIFHGEVINIRDVVTFEGESVQALENAFRESIDDYLAFCAARGEEPDTPFSGKFLLRIPPELHRKVHIRSRLDNKSINTWVTETIEAAIED